MPPAPILILPDRKSAAKILAIAAAALVASLLVIFCREDISSRKLVVLCFILAPVMVFLIIFTLRKFLANAPILTISAEGIIDRASPIGVGLIRWDEILELSATAPDNNGFSHLQIRVKDPAGILSRSGGASGQLQKIEMAGGDTIEIVDTLLPMSAAALKAQIEDYRRRLTNPA